jgi:hypothetical protein
MSGDFFLTPQNGKSNYKLIDNKIRSENPLMLLESQPSLKEFKVLNFSYAKSNSKIYFN